MTVLEGVELDEAVAHLEGLTIDGIRDGKCICGETPTRYVYSPSTNWTQGGPIIERERIAIVFDGDDWFAVLNIAEFYGYCAEIDFDEKPVCGPTPLIAAMRAFVASKGKA